MTAGFAKTDLINHLVRVHRYRHYLEIATATTGNYFAAIDRSPLAMCDRILYRYPPDRDDGLKVDFRSAGPDGAECRADLRRSGRRYDIVLVDGWHEYATAAADLDLAFELLEPGGTIVVHDCLPPEEWYASRVRVKGPWCGVTYKAYLDFLHTDRDLAYCTVDTDYGCGIIRKLEHSGTHVPARPRWARQWGDVAILVEFVALGHDYAKTYRFLRDHQRSLLHLMSPQDFLGSEEPTVLTGPAGP